MLKPLIRIFAFTGKEFNSIRRQPLLLLISLIGPLLILGLFGIGYRSQPEPLRIGLVVPPEVAESEEVDDIKQLIANNFALVGVVETRAEGIDMLRTGQAQVVEIIPSDFVQQLGAGEQAQLTYIYNTLDPQAEQTIQYSGYLQTDAVNESLLINRLQNLQTDSGSMLTLIGDARSSLDALETAADAGGSIEEQRDEIEALAGTFGALAQAPMAEMETEQADALRTQFEEVQTSLNTLVESASAGEVNDDELESAHDQLDTIEEQVRSLQSTPTTTIVSPFAENYVNLRGSTLSLMAFFAPAVTALVVQHIAVTLGALALVGERKSLKLFRAAPIAALEVLIGKYIAYFVFIGVTTAALIALLVLALDVPFRGHPLLMTGFMALFLFASLSMGFLVSAVAGSDTQAVQIAMLILLVSVFFSDFVLPYSQFRDSAEVVGYIAPMTFGMPGMRAVMLEGGLPSPEAWIGLGVISAVCFIAITLIWRGRFRG